MAFVTERIVCSLADLLTRFEQIPGRYNWHTNYLEPNATITGTSSAPSLLCSVLFCSVMFCFILLCSAIF
jgi:hypothetical protein